MFWSNEIRQSNWRLPLQISGLDHGRICITTIERERGNPAFVFMSLQSLPLVSSATLV
jgi:hypothetical protein